MQRRLMAAESHLSKARPSDTKCGPSFTRCSLSCTVTRDGLPYLLLSGPVQKGGVRKNNLVPFAL